MTAPAISEFSHAGPAACALSARRGPSQFLVRRPLPVSKEGSVETSLGGGLAITVVRMSWRAGVAPGHPCRGARLIHRLKALPPLAMIAWPVIHPASSPASMRMPDVFRLGHPWMTWRPRLLLTIGFGASPRLSACA